MTLLYYICSDVCVHGWCIKWTLTLICNSGSLSWINLSFHYGFLHFAAFFIVCSVSIFFWLFSFFFVFLFLCFKIIIIIINIIFLVSCPYHQHQNTYHFKCNGLKNLLFSATLNTLWTLHSHTHRYYIFIDILNSSEWSDKINLMIKSRESEKKRRQSVHVGNTWSVMRWELTQILIKIKQSTSKWMT